MQGPKHAMNVPESDEDSGPMIGLRLFLSAFWRARVLCLSVIGIMMVLALLYIVFIRKPVYEATAMIGPVPSATTASTQGAASLLAGLTGASGEDPGSLLLTKYTQILTSTRLAARLERKHGVMKALVAGWNEQDQRWELPLGVKDYTLNAIKWTLGMPTWQPPTPATLAQVLDRMVDVTPVAGGGDPLQLHSQYYTVTVRSPNRDYAIQLLGWILGDADAIVRQDQLVRTEGRIAYLTKTLKQTNEVSLRDYLNQLMIGQEQSLMTLKADREFAFDLVDPPNAAQSPVGVSNMVLLMISILFGLLIDAAILFSLLQDRMEAYQATGKNPLADPFPDPITLGRQKLAEFRRRRLPRASGS